MYSLLELSVHVDNLCQATGDDWCRYLLASVILAQGYLSKTLRQELREQQGVELIRSLDAIQIVRLWQRLLLRKRYIIETINSGSQLSI